MKSQMNPGSIPIPKSGKLKVENPDGVYNVYGDGDAPHSAYDAAFFGNGCSYGAFSRDGDGPFLIMSEDSRESTTRKKD